VQACNNVVNALVLCNNPYIQLHSELLFVTKNRMINWGRLQTRWDDSLIVRTYSRLEL